MKIQLIGSTNRISTIPSMKKFSTDLGRICYTEKDWEEVKNEELNSRLTEGMLSSGHHSTFEHMDLNFYITGLPKALAMALNNEKAYTTSEKSARYTLMTGIDNLQSEKYNKWMDILYPRIDAVYPMTDSPRRKRTVRNLSRENSRYMLSVFAPTKMGHSLRLRQLNFVRQQFGDFIKVYGGSEDVFKSKLAISMKEFLQGTEKFYIPNLENQTDRHLSLFFDENLFKRSDVKEYFGDVYSTQTDLSFAGLAQAHRHRTINYNIAGGTEQGAPYGFFVPEIIQNDTKLSSEWLSDLDEIAKYDFPQAQMLKVNERGSPEDFRSKAMLRLCGHAQHEIMRDTLATGKKYLQFQEMYSPGGKNPLSPKCIQGEKCNEPCAWGGKMALERII
ncbi:MAG: FAD-dependent thymidylate synthase [Nanoarchaeota archaeon]|nr:FAD-dependent thymidylate synthase [Nanoarchaeota archaeon]